MHDVDGEILVQQADRQESTQNQVVHRTETKKGMTFRAGSNHGSGGQSSGNLRLACAITST